jgi:two-component system, OmpR family, response regulator CpxR
MSDPHSHEAATGAPPRRLLVIDDDVELCSLLTEFLAREGFAIDLAYDGVKGLEAALQDRHEAIVLDVMLPGLGGFDVLRRIRERLSTPVLMLTARGDHVDRVVGLELGADDYVPKPFDPRELAARIRAVLRRTEPVPVAAEMVQIGPISVDLAAREVRSGNRVVPLTRVEFDLLVALARSAGRVLSRDELSRAALGRPFDPQDRSVDSHISNLRRKLGKAGGTASPIRTVRSAGYRLQRTGPHA